MQKDMPPVLTEEYRETRILQFLPLRLYDLSKISSDNLREWKAEVDFFQDVRLSILSRKINKEIQLRKIL